MTNDTLRRIYADGREEFVNARQEFYSANDLSSKQAYYEHNCRFYALVKARRLG